MINQTKENETSITGVNEKEEIEEEEKSIRYSPNNFPYKYIKRNYKSIEHSDSKKNQKIISIIFPTIRPHNSNRISNLLMSSQKYIKIKQEINDENNYKSQKNISVPISNLRNKINNLNYDNNTYKNTNSNQNESINNISTNNDYCLTSIKETNKPYINQIECILNLESDNKKKYNKFNRLFNSPSSKTQIIKQKLFNEEHGKHIFNKFLKQELQMEDKVRLFPLFLERYSPRLLRKRNTKINNLKPNNYGDKRNDDIDDEYKIKNAIFKNQTIPYLEKIDARKQITNLPPIILGSQYNLPNKSEENIKKEKFYVEIEKMERVNRKGKSRSNKKMTKKELVKFIKNKILIKCKNLIHKTKNNITDTKDSINRFFNKLKTSLNQFDDWNNPENADNLYDD